VEDVGRPELVGRLLEQLYGDLQGSDIPREILVPEQPDDPELYQEFLGLQRGSKVRVRVPQRGAKRQLMETVTQNAGEAFARHKLKRASDHNARARALVALQDALQLPEAPLRIECYDISNLQGTEIVASMVVMEDGLPKRSDYRRFKIRHQPGQDDFASMEEVLTRRFRRYLHDRDEGARSGKRFAYPPNLVLIDGGKGQLGVAVRVLEELGLEDIAVASLAKRFEEVYVPGQPDPVRIPRDSEALYLLQQVRDEAHRFAITYHRQLRGKTMTRSALDDVPGLGPTRRARLLKEYGSVKRLRGLDEDELVAIPWLPEKVARALYAHLHGGERPQTTPRATPRDDERQPA
jgi:excinuclease ABC subunit C